MKIKDFGCINDMPRGWVTQSTLNHTIYKKWVAMWRRVNASEGTHNYKYYHNCSICEEWKLLSNFVKWIESQPLYEEFKLRPKDFAIDKDFKKEGNKTYCPEYCTLMTKIDNIKEVSINGRNNFITNHPSNNLEYRKNIGRRFRKGLIGIKGSTILLFKSCIEAEQAGYSGARRCANGEYTHSKGFKWYFLIYKHNKRFRIN